MTAAERLREILLSAGTVVPEPGTVQMVSVPFELATEVCVIAEEGSEHVCENCDRSHCEDEFCKCKKCDCACCEAHR